VDLGYLVTGRHARQPRGLPAGLAAAEAAVRALPDTVRPGGLLLAVYDDLDDDHREHMKSRAPTRRLMPVRTVRGHPA
jgi:hypothetical protein